MLFQRCDARPGQVFVPAIANEADPNSGWIPSNREALSSVARLLLGFNETTAIALLTFAQGLPAT